ncbi:MAG: Bug family tripartite tricarboxylate transporter substrate binding protein [Rhabdaerophilum sp.]
MIARRTLLLSSLVPLFAGPSFGQSNYPDGKVIRAVVPFAPGSATDNVARVYLDHMSQTLGTTIIIENKPGAGGILGADTAAKSAPDGLTLLVGTNSTNAAAPALFNRVPFDHEKDFAPISFLGSVPLLVCVSNKLPVKTLADLIALAKQKPGELNFGTASASQRVSTEMFMSMAGIKMNMISYRASPQAVQDLLTGTLDVFVADLAVTLPQVQAGAIRALAATSAARISQLPDLPTVEEAGNLKGYELIAWFGLFAPARTPSAIIARLNDAAVKASRDENVRKKLSDGLGISVASSTPAELAAKVRTEAVKWAKAVDEAKIEKQ